MNEGAAEEDGENGMEVQEENRVKVRKKMGCLWRWKNGPSGRGRWKKTWRWQGGMEKMRINLSFYFVYGGVEINREVH